MVRPTGQVVVNGNAEKLGRLRHTEGVLLMETSGGGAVVVEVVMCTRSVLLWLTVTLFSLVQSRRSSNVLWLYPGCGYIVSSAPRR